MIRRNLEQLILDALLDTPILLINGARQTGKSTLARALLGGTHEYYTLDDPTLLASIKRDPSLFLDQLIKPSIIDEVQRAPELFLPLKKLVDENKRPGHFVLTGSANVLTLPKLADSLAGRMEIHTLWPFSQGELLGRKEQFIEALFSAQPIQESSSLDLDSLLNLIIAGGYPDAVQRESESRRNAWLKAYLTTILERDIRDISRIEGLSEIPALLGLIATRTSSLLNASELSRSLGLSATTLSRYMTLLQQIYLLVTVPAWAKNAGKRFVKAPKIYLNDTGLLSHLLFYNKEKYLSNMTLLGHVLENFVVMELLKQKTWSTTPFNIYHYRVQDTHEVDIVLESYDGKIIGIEVKLAKQVSQNDFKGLASLEDTVGTAFHRGIVLYMGSQTVPFSEKTAAVPISALWGS